MLSSLLTLHPYSYYCFSSLAWPCSLPYSCSTSLVHPPLFLAHAPCALAPLLRALTRILFLILLALALARSSPPHSLLLASSSLLLSLTPCILLAPSRSHSLCVCSSSRLTHASSLLYLACPLLLTITLIPSLPAPPHISLAPPHSHSLLIHSSLLALALLPPHPDLNR